MAFLAISLLLTASVVTTPPNEIVRFVSSYALAAICWALTCRYYEHASTGLIIGSALILRLFAMLFEPALSHDVYRYLWDGRVAATGTSPYAYAPSDAHLQPLRTAWHSRINHAEIRTIYPPIAQLWFVVAAGVGGTLWSWKFLLLIADTITVLLLLRSFDRAAAMAYALCPLVIVEGFWNGHVEIIAGAFLIGACIALQRDKVAWAGVLLGIAAGTKIVPLAAAPAMARRGKQWTFLAALFAAIAIPALPFIKGSFMPGFGEYARRWIFNSPGYDLLHRLVSSIHLAANVKSAFIAMKDSLRLELIAGYVYAYSYDEFVTRVTLGLIFVSVVMVIVRKTSSTIDAVLACVGALLLCSPTIHPWYWLTLLPLALVTRSTLWIGMALCAPFSYLLYVGGPKWMVYGLCYGIPLLLVAWRGRRLKAEGNS